MRHAVPTGSASPVRRLARSRALRWGVGALEAVVGLGALTVVALASLVPTVMGWVPLTVLTGSMAPTIPAGSLVVVRPLSEEQATRLGVGSVVTYQSATGGRDLVTHRIVSLNVLDDGTTTYTIQGDANAAPDPAPVRPAQVLGLERYHVPVLGRLLTLVGPEVKQVGRLLAGVALLAYAAWQVVAALRERRRCGRKHRDHAPSGLEGERDTAVSLAGSAPRPSPGDSPSQVEQGGGGADPTASSSGSSSEKAPAEEHG